MADATATAPKSVSLIRASEETSEFPGLGRVGQLFAHGLADILATNGEGTAKVRCGETMIMSFEDWRAQKGEARATCRYRMNPLKGGMLLSIPQIYVTRLVDRFYGGDGEGLTAQKELTAAEERFLSRLCETLGTILVSAWAEMIAIEAPIAKIDHSGSSPTLTALTRQVAVQSLWVEGAMAKPFTVDMVYPLNLLRGVPQLLAMPEQEEAPQVDHAWQQMMADAAMQVRLPVRTVFARPELPLAQLLNLKAGDIIPVCLPNQVPVTVAGRLFAHASVGDSNGRTAIKIERIEEGSIVYE